MKRINTWADATATKEAELDLGDGLNARIPLGRPYTFDQSAGRVVKIWDYLNKREQIIYGDTGVRDITSLSTASAGRILLSRQGNTCWLYLEEVVPGTITTYNYDLLPAGTIPSGFRPAQSYWQDIPSQSNNPNGTRLYAAVARTGWLPIYNGAKETDRYRAIISYPTPNPWPTSLPGVPAH